MLTLQTRIKQAREEAGYTQAELCKQLGITPMTIYRWETGKAMPRLQQLETLSGLTNRPLYWFFAPDQVAVVEPSSLTPTIIELIKTCQALNVSGQAKILSIATDYLELAKYTK